MASKFTENNEQQQQAGMEASKRYSLENKILIEEFFLRDDISRQSPGKKDYLVIKNKETRKRETHQKRYLVMSVGEAFEQFKVENPSVKIKKSLFYMFRPEYVMLLSKMPHDVCVCRYHANFDFLIRSVHKKSPNFPENGKCLLETITCDIEKESCMTNMCNNCQDSVIELVPDCHKNEMISWKQWTDIDGRSKQVENYGSVEDAISEIEDQLSKYKIHCYVKSVQSKKFEHIKSNLKDDEALLQV